MNTTQPGPGDASATPSSSGESAERHAGQPQPAPTYGAADTGPGQGAPSPLKAPPPELPHPRSGLDGFFDRLRGLGLVRPADRSGPGVCAAIGHRVGLDPLVIRIAVVLLALFAGLGVFLYGLGWLLLPQADGRIHAEEFLRRGRVSAGFVGAVLCLVFAFPGSVGSYGLGLGLFGGGDGGPAGWGLVILLVVGVLLYATRRRPGADRPLLNHVPGASGEPAHPWSGGAGPAGAYPDGAYSDGAYSDGAYPVGAYAVGAYTDEPKLPAAQAPSSPAGHGVSLAKGPQTSVMHAASPAPGPTPGPTPVSTATASAPTWRPNQTPPPLAPRPLRRTPAGARVVAGAAGLALIAGAAVMLVSALLGWRAPGGALLWAALASIAVIGAATMAVGAVGRRGGGLIGLSVITLILSLVAGVASVGRDWYERNPENVRSIGTPFNASLVGPVVADENYRVSLRSGTLDLSGITAPEPGAPVHTLNLDVSVGELVVKVPADVTVEIDIANDMGVVTINELDDPGATAEPAPESSATPQASPSPQATPTPEVTPNSETPTAPGYRGASGYRGVQSESRTQGTIGPDGPPAVRLTGTADLSSITIEQVTS